MVETRDTVDPVTQLTLSQLRYRSVVLTRILTGSN
jgi:hypothetical protein